MQRFKLLPLAAATLVGLGLSSQAQAGAYARSVNDIFNLTLPSNPALGLPNLITFSATSTSGATLNGVSAPPGSSTVAGPTAYVQSTIGTAPRPVGSFAPIGAAGTYASGAAQIPSTELIGSPPIPNNPTTRAANIAESNLATTATGDARGQNSSLTGINTQINVPFATQLTFQFEADPELFVSLLADSIPPSSALAALTVGFTVTNNSTGATVFDWAPRGLLDPITGAMADCVGCVVNGGQPAGVGPNANPFTLNTSRTVTTAGTSADYRLGAPAGQFRATSVSIDPGTYTISLVMNESVTTQQLVPEPASLGLLGIGLLGMSLLRRRHQQV